MDARRKPELDLISAVQRVENLSYVLALNPYHSAALESLNDAVDFVVSESTRRGITTVSAPAAELRTRLDRPIDRYRVNEVVRCARRLHGATVYWLNELLPAVRVQSGTGRTGNDCG